MMTEHPLVSSFPLDPLGLGACVVVVVAGVTGGGVTGAGVVVADVTGAGVGPGVTGEGVVGAGVVRGGGVAGLSFVVFSGLSVVVTSLLSSSHFLH